MANVPVINASNCKCLGFDLFSNTIGILDNMDFSEKSILGGDFAFSF